MYMCIVNSSTSPLFRKCLWSYERILLTCLCATPAHKFGKQLASVGSYNPKTKKKKQFCGDNVESRNNSEDKRRDQNADHACRITLHY